MIKTAIIDMTGLKRVLYKVRRVFIHPDFKHHPSGLPINDLALVQTRKPFALETNSYSKALRLCNPKEMITALSAGVESLLGFCGLGSVVTNVSVLAIPDDLQELLFTQTDFRLCPKTMICVKPQNKLGKHIFHSSTKLPLKESISPPLATLKTSPLPATPKKPSNQITFDGWK